MSNRVREGWLPGLAFLVIAAIAVGVYASLVTTQSTLLKQRTELALDVAERTLDHGLRVRAEALSRLGQRMTVEGATGNDALFRTGARRFLADFKGLVALGWQPVGSAPGVYEAAAPAHLAALSAPLPIDGLREPRVARTQVGEAASYARFAIPAWDEDGRLVGHVLAAFVYTDLFDDILSNMPTGFEIALHAGGSPIYSRPVPQPASAVAPYAARRERPYFGEPLEVAVWPAERTAAVFRSRLPMGLLVSGLAVALLIGATLRFSAVARARARDAEAALARVSAEAEHRESVQATLAVAHDELRRRNDELQDFVFASSHDLQEPLRKIRAFGDRLRAKCGPELGELGVDYLQRMQGAAGRMQELIDALLDYSRVSSQSRPMKPVDLNVIAHEVVSDLETTIEAADGRVILGTLPMLVADPVHMRQLLQNLITNGLKFRSPARAPEVRVSAYPIVRDERSWCRLVVSDNGIGFDNLYAERIFAPFKRLHARDEYEGTGIGLAIVRRIVERHNGSIAAEGRPGEGATFTIDFPAEGEAAAPGAGRVGPPAAA